MGDRMVHEEMLLNLAQFFKKEGLMDKVDYRARNDVPYSFKEIKRIFTNYASMIHHVRQVDLTSIKEDKTVMKKRMTRKRAMRDIVDDET